MLAWCKILASFRGIDAVGLVVPVADVDNVDDVAVFRVGKNGILHIFCSAESYVGFLAGLLFPFVNSVKPEFHKMLRTCELGADKMNHIRIIGKIIKIHADEIAMEVATHGMVDVIEHVGDKDTLVPCERHRLREVGGIDVVGRAPRRIHPVGTGFEDVVLEIVFVEKKLAETCTFFSEPVESVPVPCVRAGEVIFAQSVPCRSFSASGERLLVERCPYVAVATADAFVVITSAFIPESVVVVKDGDVVVDHISKR